MASACLEVPEMVMLSIDDYLKYPPVTEFDTEEFLKPLNEMDQPMYMVVINNQIGCFNRTNHKHVISWDLSINN